ncbi:excinuclease ABC subunit B [candidate division WOR-3 bacterium RBG_13_43_14]|uniref:UvrABC system protein B n=1 Tax=candidate division WOR-3 bacterium RBG_13_43_14 TaxID=1802590 RepID=A0A1F4U1V2_UNCW3|nr:MAG: excinuclease ABC subunit B [candidate division WOR-3 bacterium RBG_13_43_14]
MKFKLTSPYNPKGDQPSAIDDLVKGIRAGRKYQTLLGVTGSGKTFTVANVIEKVQKPTLVISHNKTLAAQLYGEFKQFFPENAVEYFISYYDYYQPEAYVPETDLYIEKDASINEEISRLRLRATSSLLTRRDVIIIASVSCIYNIGSPEEVQELVVTLSKGSAVNREEILTRLVDIQYNRNDIDHRRGTFRVRGDVIDVWPADEDLSVKIELFDDTIESIKFFDPVTGNIIGDTDNLVIFPARQYVTTRPRIEEATVKIKEELKERVNKLEKNGKLLEAQRLVQRTNYDMEMLVELGYCSGIENYSMHLSGRKPGERPFCLIDYFPKDLLVIIDESHVTIPQLNGMYEGDRSRKQTLIDFGFRLPSALENRPLKFEEITQLLNQVLCISATPGQWEIEQSNKIIIEQIVRPTGIIDPKVTVRPAGQQVDDLINEIRKHVDHNERALVTTLTKRMAEDLAEYLNEIGIKVRYMHSEIDALQRVEILRGLRLGEFDVLVGINLLREGLDLPEVALVAILDADREGFLRSERSLIQTAGRAARNVRSEVIMYADEITESMARALGEMERRRQKQIAYNVKHTITPTSIVKTREEIIRATSVADHKFQAPRGEESLEEIAKLYEAMARAVAEMEFEKAAEIRDRIKDIKKKLDKVKRRKYLNAKRT